MEFTSSSNCSHLSTNSAPPMLFRRKTAPILREMFAQGPVLEQSFSTGRATMKYDQFLLARRLTKMKYSCLPRTHCGALWYWGGAPFA